MKPGDSELPLNLLTTEKKKTTELFAAFSPRFSVCLPSTRLVRESDSAISHSTRAWSKGEQLLFTQPDKDTARKLQQITHPGLIADRVGLSSRISVTFLILVISIRAYERRCGLARALPKTTTRRRQDE